MPVQGKLSGNPAAKRMSNKNLQERRSRSWARGKMRKGARDVANGSRAAHNRTLRASGQLTAWEQVRVDRRAYRAAQNADKRQEQKKKDVFAK